MVVKVISYFDVPGKFSPEEGNELIKDWRKAINDFLGLQLKGGTSCVLSSGKKCKISFLTETEAKEKVIGSAHFEQLKSPSKEEIRRLHQKFPERFPSGFKID